MNTTTILIRHNRRRAVVAHVGPTDTGIRLLRLTPDSGPVPEYGHLSGREFPDMSALRRAVLAAMRGPVGTTLDRVLLSPWAYHSWLKTVEDTDLADLDPQLIPDEQARPISGGRLLIWVDLPNGRKVDLIIPPEHWAWAGPRNQ